MVGEVLSNDDKKKKMLVDITEQLQLTANMAKGRVNVLVEGGPITGHRLDWIDIYQVFTQFFDGKTFHKELMCFYKTG